MSERFNDKAMIENPRDWPGETLCLKKRPMDGETTGVMGYSAFGVLTKVARPLVIYLRPNFDSTVKYDTVDAMLADGWIVD